MCMLIPLFPPILICILILISTHTHIPTHTYMYTNNIIPSHSHMLGYINIPYPYFYS